MERESRSDLLKILEKEREKNRNYEAKLKDVVAAYKSKDKENQTLQATVKSLRATRKIQVSSNDDQNAAASESTVGQPEEGNPQQELENLYASMTELLEEKKKIEAAAISERKTLKLEYEEKICSLETKLHEANNELSSAIQQGIELKKKLRAEQMDREKEQADHSAILRELNKNVHEHMIEKDDLRHQVADLHKELLILKQMPSQSENNEIIIADLNKQLESMRLKIKDHDNNTNQQIKLGQLQKEISELNQRHKESVEREHVRADEAERTMQDIAKKSESRICELESKISQLSEMVGNYEKLRLNDQQAIQKLKSRVTQLDVENTELAKVVRPDLEDIDLNLNDLSEKLKKLKSSLRQACESAQPTVDYQLKLAEIFLDETQLHKKCDEEYSQLKEEFERYKLRAQSVLKTKHSKDQNSSKEVEDMKNTIIELKDKIRHSSDRHNTEMQGLHQTIAELRQSISNLHTIHKQELSALTSDCEQKVCDAEQRLHQHRERTISMLAEKDDEIESLRLRMKSNLNSVGYQHQSRLLMESEQDESTAMVERLLSTDAMSSGQLIHVQHEIARQNLEITALRKQKHELESALQQVQQGATTKQEQYELQLGVLKEEIHRLDRNVSREGTNLEYLKNVVYKFMMASDSTSKKAIFNAICTILHFSAQEKKALSERM